MRFLIFLPSYMSIVPKACLEEFGQAAEFPTLFGALGGYKEDW
jgi:hypothetical protein